MTEAMNISVNGQSQVPPGFRFHPTEEELLQYYLKKKVSNIKIDLDVIREVDLNKLEPWDIQERCKIGTTPQNDWYFFSHKDKKYPTGTRTNRATAAGFWKATGRDKVIYSSYRRIGMRKTLVFYKGRAPHGEKSDWIMHEYRLDDTPTTHETNAASAMGDAGQEEGWVVCRIFKKKNLNKTLNSPAISSDVLSRTQMLSNEEAVEQILEYMGRSCKEEINMDPFMKLPSLGSPLSADSYQPVTQENDSSITNRHVDAEYNNDQDASFITNWAALDRLVASQLNGPTMGLNHDQAAVDHLDHFSTVRSLSDLTSCIPRQSTYHGGMIAQEYNDLWSGAYARTTSPLSSPSTNPLCHVSNDSE